MIITFIMMIVSGVWADVPIDEAHFPDPVLREWLQNLAWFDGWKQIPVTDYEGNVTGYRWEWSAEYKDGVLNEYELNHKDFISISDSSLSDLSGIEHLPNLKRVYCSKTSVKTVNISGMSNLTEFHLGGPALVSFNASGCSSLKVLGCGDSPNLKELNVSGCSSLHTIYCTNTPSLAKVNLSGCGSLQSFCGGNNGLDSISFSGSSVMYVCADGPALSEVNVSGCSSLKELWLGSKERKLKRLNLSGCSSLLRLGCQETGLEELDLSDCTQLYELHGEKNSLTELDLSGNTSLTTDYCRGQSTEGLQVRSVHEGYEVNLNSYVNFIR